MDIILQTKVPNLGNIGDRVKVKPGYARNYLLPQGFAVSATPKNVADFESRRADLERKAAEELQKAHDRAKQLEGLSIKISAQASDEGKLYGSVGTHEIVHALTEKNIHVQRREVRLPDGALRSTGEYTISLQLHSDVTASFTIIVEAAK